MNQKVLGTAKVFGYWITKNYRDAYGIFASNGILFNHEGIYRGETFVTKKIASSVANIFLKKEKILVLGNLDAKRDWGDAEDYVAAMHKMMQLKKPDDFVICSGKSFTVRKFVEMAFKVIGVKIKWKGKGQKEIGYDLNNPKRILVKVSDKYFRPNEVNFLKGNPNKAKKILKWQAKKSLETMVREMVEHSINN